jgi:hypothetical protein
MILPSANSICIPKVMYTKGSELLECLYIRVVDTARYHQNFTTLMCQTVSSSKQVYYFHLIVLLMECAMGRHIIAQQPNVNINKLAILCNA